MIKRVQCGLTAGIALVGASVIAVTPITPSTPAPPRLVEASSALMASFAGMSQAELVAEFGERLAEQSVQAPLLPLVIAMQIAGGDNARLYSQIRQIVDSPVYVADPLIEAIADTLPPQLGGGSDDETTTSAGDGAFMQFRNVQLLGFRDAVNGVVADALGVSPTVLNENYAAMLAEGLAESAVRMASGAALAPLGLIPVAQAVVSGDNAALYTAIRQYTDAPLWAVDPAIEGLAQALPESLGGGSDGDFTTQEPEDGALMRFRNERLWTATRDTRRAVADVLGVELDPQDNPVDPQPSDSSLQRTAVNAAKSDEDSSRDVSKLKPHFTNLDAAAEPADDATEKRTNKVGTRAKEAVERARATFENVAKNLKPKNAEHEKNPTADAAPEGADD